MGEDEGITAVNGSFNVFGRIQIPRVLLLQSAFRMCSILTACPLVVAVSNLPVNGLLIIKLQVLKAM